MILIVLFLNVTSQCCFLTLFLTPMTISIFHLPCKLVACVHRHYVFTIPEELRAYFLKDRALLDCLFHSICDVVLHMFSKMNKTENFTPWRPVKHFDYNFLRNAFRKVLLEQLTSRIGSTFHKVKNEIYTKYADGFYVRSKPNLCTIYHSLFCYVIFYFQFIIHYF